MLSQSRHTCSQRIVYFVKVRLIRTLGIRTFGPKIPLHTLLLQPPPAASYTPFLT